MELIVEEPRHSPIARRCHTLKMSPATLYRLQKPVPRVYRSRPPSPRRLPEAERERVLDVMHTAEFCDQPPAEIVATLLDRGVYLASIRTMYRILKSVGESIERRVQRRRVHYEAPRVLATRPHQVWTWDITRLAGPRPGIFFFLYVFLDLYSRFPVAWAVEESESAAHAESLFLEACARHGIAPDSVHNDRGAPMKSVLFTTLLESLGVAHSFSRPRVSDDNPFIESHFRTLKYQPEYPDRFGSVVHARAYCELFFNWFANDHHHSALALFTPADVFFGRVLDAAMVRQSAIDSAFHANPTRFPNGPPRVRLPPAIVAINPIDVNCIHLAKGTHVS
jgi:putative transposase